MTGMLAIGVAPSQLLKGFDPAAFDVIEGGGLFIDVGLSGIRVGHENRSTNLPEFGLPKCAGEKGVLATADTIRDVHARQKKRFRGRHLDWQPAGRLLRPRGDR